MGWTFAPVVARDDRQVTRRRSIRSRLAANQHCYLLESLLADELARPIATQAALAGPKT